MVRFSCDVELNPGPITRDSKDLLRIHSADLAEATATNLYRTANALYAKGLIPRQTVEEVLIVGVTDHVKAMKLMLEVQRQLESSHDPDQYLIDTCHVLRSLQHLMLTEIATSILKQISNYSDEPSAHNKTASSRNERTSQHSGSTFTNAISQKIAMILPPRNQIPKQGESQTSSIYGTDQPVTSENELSHHEVRNPQKETNEDLHPPPPALPSEHTQTYYSHTDKLPYPPGTSTSAPIPVHTGTSPYAQMGMMPIVNYGQLYPQMPFNFPVVTHTKTTSESKYLSFSTDKDLQQYGDIIRDRYKHQPIVATDWPPRVGQDFFGRLALIETKESYQQRKAAWYMIRGQIDQIPKLAGNKPIPINDILEPKGPRSLRILVDGPPGIGKTTLCRKLCNMWANGTLKHQQFDLVLYCPLRNSKVAQATTLSDLFVYESQKVSKVVEWLENEEGQGLLIVFDGWDELSSVLRQSSLATSIIRCDKLAKCSVVVTSRTYASSTLLRLETLSRHVQVIGFSEEEIEAVVRGTLKEESPQLAEKLISDLKVRGDVQSLCYLPLVCSMVILIYCNLNGDLPATLTELYCNFILQTIKRHVEKSGDFEAEEINSLEHLPKDLDTPFQEICQFAYRSLNQDDHKITFSAQQLQEFLITSGKKNFLGLMTSYTENYIKVHQFIHLSIQEFLAAFWITKHEKTESCFKHHFKDDHFRLCLRFVAGLTHLKPEKDYRQYFTKPLDLQCQRKLLLDFESCHESWFFQNPEITKEDDHNDSVSDFPFLNLQLLYESQNTKICFMLAQSFKNHSLCLNNETLTQFDILCLGYFLVNSGYKWNHLHLGDLEKQNLTAFSTGVTNNISECRCRRLEVQLDDVTSVYDFLRPPLLNNIRECYCEFPYNDKSDHCSIIVEFLKLSQLTILHLKFDSLRESQCLDYKKFLEIEECLEENTILHEMKITCTDEFQEDDLMMLSSSKSSSASSSASSSLISLPSTVSSSSLHDTGLSVMLSMINGIRKNRSISSFALISNDSPLPDEALENLLKENCTLKALKINVPDKILPPTLNIQEVNTPLTTLHLGGKRWKNSKLMTSFLPHITGLQRLALPNKLFVESFTLPRIFQFHPSLQQAVLSLSTPESVIELFSLLQNNVTLQSLKLEVEEAILADGNVGLSLQYMLLRNKTLQDLKIITSASALIPTSYLSFLISSLPYNTSLQRLMIPIPLSTNEQTILFNVFSKMCNLTELHVFFTLDTSAEKNDSKLMLQLFFEHGLPLVVNMLQSHQTLISLKIMVKTDDHIELAPSWEKCFKTFLDTIYLNSSIEKMKFKTIPQKYSPMINNILDKREKKLQVLRKQKYPTKPLLMTEFNNEP